MVGAGRRRRNEGVSGPGVRPKPLCVTTTCRDRRPPVERTYGDVADAAIRVTPKGPLTQTVPSGATETAENTTPR